MQSAISKSLQKPPKKKRNRVKNYTPVQEGYQSASARTASTRNFQVRGLKSALAVVIALKERPEITFSDELIPELVDLINELVLEGNPTIKRKLIKEGNKAWADGRRVWSIDSYGCLRSKIYKNVTEAQVIEYETNK